MIVRRAIPDRKYTVGEELEFIVDPGWGDHRWVWDKDKKCYVPVTQVKQRQAQLGRVHSFTESSVMLVPLGEPWDAPVKPGN